LSPQQSSEGETWLALRPTKRASTLSEVERLLLELLPHGRADVSEVARRLGVSSRTLSRKLHKEGVAFAEIPDELRKALAKRYLDEHELQVSEIAWLLGYREVSSFTHAFKRWTGITPRQFRLSTRARGKSKDGGPPTKGMRAATAVNDRRRQT
jgi:AraC-like DNA-binding protein